MQKKIAISVEPREGLTHTIVIDEDVVLKTGDALTIQLGRDGDVADMIITTPDPKKAGGA